MKRIIMSKRLRWTLAYGLLALEVSGCGGSAGDLQRKQLSVTGDWQNSSTAEYQPAVLWYNIRTGEHAATMGAVSGDFPQTFRTELTGLPPEGAARTVILADECGEETLEIAQGYIVGLADDQLDNVSHETHLTAGDPNHLVLFLYQDVPVGSSWAAHLGGPLKAGYHLLRVTPPQQGFAECFDQLDAACQQAEREGTTKRSEAFFAQLRQRYAEEVDGLACSEKAAARTRILEEMADGDPCLASAEPVCGSPETSWTFVPLDTQLSIAVSDSPQTAILPALVP